MSKPSITSGQKKQIKRVCSDGVDSGIEEVVFELGISEDTAQNVILAQGDRIKAAMQSAAKQVITEIAGAVSKFQLLKTVEIVVPENYDHDTRLDSFHREHGGEFYYYNDAVTDANYSGKATTRLVPGRKLRVKIFQIKTQVSSDECMAFLLSQKAILTGAHGASLVWEQKKEDLLINRWSISFDEKDALWQDSDGDHGVPGVDRDSGGDFEFFLGYFENPWDERFCLLCFCD
jgi:hypothetical protein